MVIYDGATIGVELGPTRQHLGYPVMPAQLTGPLVIAVLRLTVAPEKPAVGF